MIAERKRGDERADGSMMNENEHCFRETGGEREREGCFALPEVTYPWTVSCLEYGIAR